MIYFIYNNVYCSASYINDELAAKVTYITKEEYDAEMERIREMEIEEISEE